MHFIKKTTAGKPPSGDKGIERNLDIVQRQRDCLKGIVVKPK